MNSPTDTPIPDETATVSESAISPEPSTNEVPPLEKALDFAFGVGLLTAESLSTFGERLSEASKQMQEHAPDFIREMQEKGRPTRERVLSDLGEVAGESFCPFEDTATVRVRGIGCH